MNNRQLLEILRDWEHYDSFLTPRENFIELKLSLGFFDEAKKILKKFSHE